jgi:hypothetical protein
VALPAAIVTVAGYVAVAGGVISAVSQVTVDDAALEKASIDFSDDHDNSLL